jgi:site-specific DNA-cytosine methylase
MMRYLSLFSGLGGFEIAIHDLWPRASCVAYSEIKPEAIEVYSRRFPDHMNLGDIEAVTPRVLDEALRRSGGCDLVVAGFPCTNLSTMSNVSGDNRGLEGSVSRLFFPMLRVLQHVLRRTGGATHVMLENTAWMTNDNKRRIDEELRAGLGLRFWVSVVDSSTLGCAQRRVRRYWTTFEPGPLAPMPRRQTVRSLLDPLPRAAAWRIPTIGFLNNVVKGSGDPSGTERNVVVAVPRPGGLHELVVRRSREGLTRLSYNASRIARSDQDIAPPLTTGLGSFGYNLILDARAHPRYVLIRYWTTREVERLACLPRGHLAKIHPDSLDRRALLRALSLAGNMVLPPVVRALLQHLPEGRPPARLSSPRSRRPSM